MKAEPLNWEMKLFYKDDEKEPLYIEFHSTRADLARDHVWHCLRSEPGTEVAHFRKKGNENWKVVLNN